MKKKVFLLLIVLLILLFSFLFYQSIPKIEEVKKPSIEEITPQKEEVIINYEEIIQKLKNTYQNDDVIGILEIPNILNEVVLQTRDNDYYLYHDAYREETNIGATFLDYRVNLRDSNKILIYGHSDPEGVLPFVKLTNYNTEEFMKANPYIYLTDSQGKRKFEVFSSYIETTDFDYVNLNSFSGLNYQEHLEKLKKKSFVKTNVELKEDTKVLVLQTCSFDERIQSQTKYQIVVAKEIND